MNAEELVARHQIVRAFVEQEYPARHVTRIVEDAKTTYERTAQPPYEYVLAWADVIFHVEAKPEGITAGTGMKCNVVMLEDGTLRIYDVAFVHYAKF